MADDGSQAGLFPALLKYWRAKRGLSQLDLALAAGVSARHISFLETGRASPSAGMVTRLASTLGVPLRQANELLRASGHPASFEAQDGVVPAPVLDAIERMKRHQEPFPLVVIDRTYRLVDLNHGAWRLLASLLGVDASCGPPSRGALAEMGLNLAVATFDPAGAQPYIVNFEEVGRALLSRVQREVLADPQDAAMRALLDRLLASPMVPHAWREPDLGVGSDPVVVLHLRVGGRDLRFVTMVTAFQAPQNVIVEELRLESWFPYDAPTAAAMAPDAA